MDFEVLVTRLDPQIHHMSSPYTVYGYFDSQTRQFVAFTKSKPPHTTNLLTRIVSDDPDIDVKTLKWVGDYDSGSLQVIKPEDKIIVDPQTVLKQQLEVFFRQYSMHAVVVNILQQLSLMLPILPSDRIDPSTQQMVNLYQKVHAAYANQLAMYANSPEYIITPTKE